MTFLSSGYSGNKKESSEARSIRAFGGFVRYLYKRIYIRMASQEGFEPPTDALEGRCSIQLSY